MSRLKLRNRLDPTSPPRRLLPGRILKCDAHYTTLGDSNSKAPSPTGKALAGFKRGFGEQRVKRCTERLFMDRGGA